MKFSLLNCVVLSVVLSIFLVGVTSQSTVSCETIGTENMGWGEFKTCSMYRTTTISSDGFVISSADSTVQATRFDGNKKIRFLPIRLDETFPNMVFYSASRCSIKTVSKKNFGNLKKLKVIYLHGNQVKRINSDTFEDLTSLELLWLDGNKIKQINGAPFRDLFSLTKVFLRGNVCINKDYTTRTAIATLTRDVTKKCGFTDVEENTENIANQVFQSLNVLMEKMMKENGECLASKVETAATMLAEIDALKATVQVKLEEISGLLDEQATNRATMKEKTAEIALLRKTLETQSSN